MTSQIIKASRHLALQNGQNGHMETPTKAAHGQNGHSPRHIKGRIRDVPNRKANEQCVTWQRKPFFIVGQTLLACALWFIFAMKQLADGSASSLAVAKAGLDSIAGDGSFDLRLTRATGNFCEDFRPQVWRWFTYQFTHTGISHIASNTFANFLYGIPLEGLHGSRRMFVMYNIGVFGGACCSLLNDPHTPTVGMSGGCYALIGMQLADLLMNWRRNKFRCATLVMILGLAILDILHFQIAIDGISHASHIGGYITGTIIGIVIGKNTEVDAWERRLTFFSLVVGLLLTGFCLSWSLGNWAPRDIWEEVPWCWSRQVRNDRLFGTSQWLCIRCGEQSCIDRWAQESNIAQVSIATCRKLGWTAR